MVGAASVTYAFYVGLSGLYLVTGLLSVLIPAAITWFWFRKRSVVQDGEEMPCMGLGEDVNDISTYSKGEFVFSDCPLRKSRCLSSSIANATNIVFFVAILLSVVVYG